MVRVVLGGIHGQGLGFAAAAAAPLSIDDAHELINQLRARALLGAADVDALARVIVALSGLALSDRIDEIDLNPVIVHRKGQGVSVVDALIVKRQDYRTN